MDLTLTAEGEGEVATATVPPERDNRGFVFDVPSGQRYVLTGRGEVPPDSWGPGGSCEVHRRVVDALARETHDLGVLDMDCWAAEKPNLYLYPAADTPTQVVLRHHPRQVLFASDPPYDGGWRGVAHPDGTFTPEAGERSPFLFYEITLLPSQVARMQRDDVWCLPADDIVSTLAELLGRYGFNARERQDFIDAWTPWFPSYPHYAVRPQVFVDPVVALDVRPRLPIHRLWLVVEDGTGCVPSASAPRPFDRRGPHGVEWGVVLNRRVR